MCSSSTASTTCPRAVLDSISRMPAARSSSTVASCSESSSWRANCRPMTTNSPPPRRMRIAPNVAKYHAVSPRRRRASGGRGMRSAGEPIAGTAYRLNQLRLEAIVDLASQSPNEDLEDVRKRVVVVVPHMCRNRRAIHDLAAMEDKEFEEGELFRRQLDRSAGAADAARGQVYFEIGDRRDARHHRRLSSHQGTNAGHELTERKWLGDIIV